jgi:hypothetical protein
MERVSVVDRSVDPQSDSAETRSPLSDWIRRIAMFLAIVFVGWHLASFVSLLREIRDRIQDHEILIDLKIEEKRLDHAPPEVLEAPDDRPQFWRGT